MRCLLMLKVETEKRLKSALGQWPCTRLLFFAPTVFVSWNFGRLEGRLPSERTLRSVAQYLSPRCLTPGDKQIART
ncbi:hypothetical protein FA15DRAFT_325022 [Coprinopsis marcescibilis]|uniref:Uncharacterized protein n=1 Tax=Coprinopsis marcescibilis TaxID=230819 RepID=A0A5C3KZ14_COPMA|nr:hypothetical protein FA15DRAFT_325022 [Coprinopsis marcescibilis]